MSFFQNVFNFDFEGNWLLADRHHIPTFRVNQNRGRGLKNVVNYVNGPHDLSGNDPSGNPLSTLNIVYAINELPKTGQAFKNWATMSIDVTASSADATAVTNREIVTSLNNDTLFSERFVASFDKGFTNEDDFLGIPIVSTANESTRVVITQKKDETNFRFYIQNGQAESALKFNQRAGVAEIPSFFARHTMENRFTFEDCQNMLILLDNTDPVDEAIINEAVDSRNELIGYDASVVKEDWELLEGRSGLFEFVNQVDPTTKITYSAGAKVGDLALKTVEVGGSTFNLPHTLEAGDIITPP